MYFSHSIRYVFAILSVCSFLGICFLIVGIFGPAWIYIHYDDAPSWTLEEGIWLSRFCRSSGGCIMRPRDYIYEAAGISDPLTSIDERDWLELKTLSCISVTGALISVVASITVLVKTGDKYRLYQYNIPLIFAFTGSVISFSTVLTPILKITSIARDGHLSSSWSLIIAAVSVGFEFITVLLVQYAMFRLCVRHYRSKRRRSRHNAREQYHAHVSRYLQDCERTNGPNTNNGNREGSDSSAYTRPDSTLSEANIYNDISVVGNGALNSSMRTFSNMDESDQHTQLPEYSALPAYNEISAV